MLGKNYFESGKSSIPSESKVIFISYRNLPCDALYAQTCADIIQETYGLDIWFDKNSECLRQANSDPEIAGCIEQGLDVASALLGIIGPETFTSPWIPYEIGGARGRQRFTKPFQYQGVPTRLTNPEPNPLIAHLIKSNEVPAFVTLGTPLYDYEDVKRWAESVSNIFGLIGKGVSRRMLFERVYRPSAPQNLRYLNWNETYKRYR